MNRLAAILLLILIPLCTWDSVANHPNQSILAGPVAAFLITGVIMFFAYLIGVALGYFRD